MLVILTGGYIYLYDYSQVIEYLGNSDVNYSNRKLFTPFKFQMGRFGISNINGVKSLQFE